MVLFTIYTINKLKTFLKKNLVKKNILSCYYKILKQDNMSINKNKNTIKGGEVIASGGFGCVFSPALKCKNKKRTKNKITKLMIRKNAIEEYDEIKNIHDKLDKIPNYENYFLINDFELCEPDKLDKKDLKNFKKKCRALPKKKITEQNINESLNEIYALNMPYGGVPIDDYIYENISYKELIPLNKSLIELLNKGIIPMNKEGIYHSDIKDSNILIQVNNNNNSKFVTRLIDWGLTTEYIPFKEYPFPTVWRNRPLQFNVPFSLILFTDEFLKKYTKYLEDGGKIDYTSLKPFMMDYIYFWLKTRGKGHYTYINNIMYMLFSNDYTNIQDEKIKTRMVENDFTLFYLSNYLIEILLHFTHFRENKTLNLRVYLDTVFIQILDIWGFITSYLPVFEILFQNYHELNEKEMKLFESLKYIFIHYLYNPRVKPIDLNELNKSLKDLDDLFESLSFFKEEKEAKEKNKRITTLGKTLRILKSTKKSRSIMKKNRTKRNKYLLLNDL